MGKRLKGTEATSLFRKLIPNLRWCDQCGVPLIGYDRCSLCASPTRAVRVVPPGDIRPAFDRDKQIIREAIERCVGKRAAAKFVSDAGFMLLNKVQAIDAADEVLVSGYSIGIREFDIYEHKWIFKPGYIGAKLIVEEKLGYYAIVSRSELKVFDTIEHSEIVEGEIPPPGFWISIATRDSKVYAVAKVLPRGDLRVHKVWKRLPKEAEIVHKPADITKAARANASRLDRLEEEAVRFLSKVRRLGFARVNISGGKDSTVAAYLASLAGIKKAMFIDTGLEFPETIRTVERVAQSLGLDLDMPSAGDAFWRAVDIYGPPARDYRWCCKICKLAPLAKMSKQSNGRMVNIVGQRQYESTSRALAGKLARSGSIAGDLVAAPIQEWTSLDVFMFIESRRLPLNPLYMRGYERIGCYMCPTSRLAEIEAVRDTHRYLWDRWIAVLERFARRAKLPREWIDYGFWRWRFEYPAEIQHLAKKLGLRPFDMLDRIALNYVSTALEPSTDSEICVSLFVDLDHANLKRLAKTMAAVDLDATIINGTIEARARHGFARIYSHGRIELCANSYSYLERLVKRVLSVIFMSTKCFGCGLCNYACPHGAIRYGNIDPSRCRRCARCTSICPAAGQLTKHGIYMLRRVSGVKETGQNLRDQSI